MILKSKTITALFAALHVTACTTEKPMHVSDLPSWPDGDIIVEGLRPESDETTCKIDEKSASFIDSFSSDKPDSLTLSFDEITVFELRIKGLDALAAADAALAWCRDGILPDLNAVTGINSAEDTIEQQDFRYEV